MKYKLNSEALLRFVVLTVLAILLFIALVTGTIQNFVHPRLNILLWISVFLLLGIAFFTLPELIRPRHNAKAGKNLLLVVPMLTALLIPTGIVQNKAVSFNTLSPSLTAAAAQRGTVIPNTITSSDDIGIDTPSSSAAAPVKFAQTITDDTFVQWYQELNKNMDSYEGATFRFKGQVFRMNDFKQNEFVPIRYAMICCAADLQPLGVLCRSDDAKNWKDKDWVWVTGKLKIETYQGQKMPVCYVTKIEKADASKQEYVYFTY